MTEADAQRETRASLLLPHKALSPLCHFLRTPLVQPPYQYLGPRSGGPGRGRHLTEDAIVCVSRCVSSPSPDGLPSIHLPRCPQSHRIPLAPPSLSMPNPQVAIRPSCECPAGLPLGTPDLPDGPGPGLTLNAGCNIFQRCLTVSGGPQTSPRNADSCSFFCTVSLSLLTKTK